MTVIPAARLSRPAARPGVVGWALWALVMVACPVIPWLDDLLRPAGRPDPARWHPLMTPVAPVTRTFMPG